MAHFFYSTHPTFHHAEKTITLHTKDEAAIPLADFIKPLVPDYHGNPLLFNGHLQTAWTVNKYFGDPFVIHYARNNHINPRDGGHFAIDVVIPEFDESLSPEDLPERTRHMPESEEAAFASDDTRPMLIALHGLSGGSHEVYLRAVLHALLTGPGGDKWEACVVNARGCAQSRISTKQLFNARWTSDIRETVEYLHRVFPNRPLFAIGFSLGANILTNYLGEQGEDCVLKAAIICSNPWQLELSSKAMHRSWIGRDRKSVV